MNIRAEIIRLGRNKESDMDGLEILVESTIDAIYVDSLNKEIRIEMTCAWEDKDRKRIVASGVDDFVVNEMRLSNIVDRVSFFNSDNVEEKSTEIAKRLFFLMRGENPNPSDLEWPPLNKKLSCIRDGALSLLEIEPVYGATVMILAKDISLLPVK